MVGEKQGPDHKAGAAGHHDRPRQGKITEAKKSGQWDAPKSPGITDEQINAVAELLRDYPTAYANFQAMAPSARKTYTRAYLDAKTDEGQEKRLLWMVERLNKNLKPM